MLQQTQAGRVVDFYQRWVKRFPDVKSLSRAKFSEIYPYWQGLGYNRRALALQRTAQKAVIEYQGKLPNDFSLLETFPGIGPYTARAVSIFSYNRPLTCIETNIRRVFIHHFFQDQENITDKEILEVADRALPVGNAREWHWALMDYGAWLKSQVQNPNRRHKQYAIQSKFEGSLRQMRGKVLKSLADGPKTSQQLVVEEKVLKTLEKEGFIRYNKKKYSLA
jgi:A/G-specific adenine glycosylase